MSDKTKALSLLKTIAGNNAEFHSDQWESIESVLKNKKTLVVERTGWGKSVVYFIATKILRDLGKGPTFLISPLLSLMRNQIDYAEKIGIKALSINSDNQDDWENVAKSLSDGSCDILLLSPERLGNDDFRRNILPNIKGGIGLFVVDEAHCISDWGHDFRPDYRRIVSIVNNLPPNVPVLATTATANSRVIDDINIQLGNDLNIIRGSLLRESLKLQVIKLHDQAERLAWLYENINNMSGSGIVYCLTTKDCDRVAKFLQEKDIDALAYHAALGTDEEERRVLRKDRENKLLNNQVKVLVATIALGMGFDKPDIGFVIHYQRPGSLVSYYQQIGRAGRKLDNAYVILLNGTEDDLIQEYFIKSAFPTEKEIFEVLNLLEESESGLKKSQFQMKMNISNSRLDKCLKYLEVEGLIAKEKTTYFKTTTIWKPDFSKTEKILAMRYNELKKMKDFVETDECHMNFIGRELDDPFAQNCNKCSNCTGEKFFPESVQKDNVLDAINFLNQDKLIIQPRKRWPAGIIAETQKNIQPEFQLSEGKALAILGDSGLGRQISMDIQKGIISDEIVNAFGELIKNSLINLEMTVVTSVPSIRRPDFVKTFAAGVAKKLNLPYRDLIYKIKDVPRQKDMNNSNYLAKNAFDSFEVKRELNNYNLILIDDFIDSGWTMTVCCYKLKEHHAGNVYPFALAINSLMDGE